MSIYTFNNKVLKYNNKLLVGGEPGPDLPPYTFRVRLTDTTYDCSNKGYTGTWTRVDNNGTWDVYYPNSNWRGILRDSIGQGFGDKKEFMLIGLNAAGVTNMERFCDCCWNMIGTIPLFNTSTLTDVVNCFYECYKVESGALALYQQMSTQSVPPASHFGVFSKCGRDTETGAAELAQIPTSWGGTMQ